MACAIVTVSDTRSPATDTTGGRIRALLEEAGHRVVHYDVVPDDPARIRGRLEELLADRGVEAVVVNGGTGLAPRDVTYEAVTALLDKRLDGFGELFRMLSFHEIGAAAMLSRAVAGTARGTVVVSLPGSTAAAELAMTRLLLPELGHMVHLVAGQPVRVRLRFFAALRERLGAGAERQVPAGATVGAVWRGVVAGQPDLARMPVRFAVDEQYVKPSHRLREDDEVAVFPPVSGGR